MIYLSLVQYVLPKFLTGICVLVSVTGIRYAPCVSCIDDDILGGHLFLG